MLTVYLSLIDDAQQRIDFEEIYTTYRIQMIHLAKSYFENEADAEDVVHDVFVRVATKHMKFIQTLSNPDDVRNYLLKATKNTALNELKRKGRSHVSIEEISESALDSFPDLADDSFLDLICTKTEYERVTQALLSMEEPYRDIMYYHFVMDLSVPEAARLLGRNIATAKKQLVRGKKLLLYKLDIRGDLKNGND